jgi:thymidylate synthase (FAD)
MKVLKNAGEFKLLATWPSEETNECAQMVLEKAGRTCYQSEKGTITPETAHRFITNVIKRSHYSVIEHGWRGYIIETPTPGLLASNLMREFWPITKYLFISVREYAVLVSANLETWRKLYARDLLKTHYKIRSDLSRFAPAIFNDNSPIPTVGELVEAIDSIDQLSDDEKLIHVAHTVQYNNCSRGLTHELVRHRVPVFSQESTRYVDESDNVVIVPPHRDENEVVFCNNPPLVGQESLSEMLAHIETGYKGLRDANWRPEDARQVLPTAIKAQIVMSCNLKEQRYIHFRRTSEFAHWEIRKVMCDEVQFFQSIYPKLFNMFEYTDEKGKDGISGYCKCLESAGFFCD